MAGTQDWPRYWCALWTSHAEFFGQPESVCGGGAPRDMRKGFNGLHALVGERLGEDLKQGALFVFCNRRHTRIKIIWWDGTGIWVCSKRLEEGTFSWPKHLSPETTKLALTLQVLAMLTDGEWICAEQSCGQQV